MNYRSLLFVPGNRPDRFEKACQSDADFVCIDFEDAVAPDQKRQARVTTLEWLAQTQHKHVGVRINALDNDFGQEDVEVLAKTTLNLPYIMVPKAASGQQMGDVANILPAALGALFPIIESAKGMRKVDDIYEHPRVKYSIFGAIDYSADIGSDMSWDAMLYARSHLVSSAHANDVILFDAPYSDVRNLEGCKAETERAKTLGVFARSAIHPAQIEPIHSALKASEAEVLYAKRVIEAIESSGGNVSLLDGKLLEEPIVKKARRIIASL